MENRKSINLLGWAWLVLTCIVCFYGITIRHKVSVETGYYNPIYVSDRKL